MKKKFIFTISLILLTITTFFFISKSPSAEKPDVLVTIAPYKYFVERLTDNSLKVRNLVPPTTDPHGFEPPAQDLLDLFSAKIWFLSGGPFEAHFIPILKKNNPEIKVADLQQGIPHLKAHTHAHCSHHHCAHHPKGEDLHFWMSPKIAKIQCQKIAELLIEQFPEKSELIQTKLIELNRDFDQLDTYLTNELKELQGSSFLVSHPAFGYFAHDYHLHQLALEDEGQDPTPRELTKLLETIQEKQIKCLYVQKQYNYKASEQIAKAYHLKLIEVNPYAENYFENVKLFGDLLKEGAHE